VDGINSIAGSKEVIFLDLQAACITATSGVYKVGSIDGKYLCCKPQQNQPSLNYLHKRIVYENIHLHASATNQVFLREDLIMYSIFIL
jgi:hypothetical protein